MKETYCSDKPISREVSQDWDTYISYAADGTLPVTDEFGIGMAPSTPLRTGNDPRFLTTAQPATPGAG